MRVWIPRYAEPRIFFWRDRSREVDFVVDTAGRLELFEAKWTELPTETDAGSLAFVRDSLGKQVVRRGTIVCRAPNRYPLQDGFHAAPIEEI